MDIPFSDRPGRHERHFRRKTNNDLFPRPILNYSNDDLLEVQRLDHEEIIDFLTELRKIVDQAVQLKPNEESEVVLDMKAALENLYETACRIGDEQENNKSAIYDLMKVIMITVRSHAGGDSKAESELLQEETAREQHFKMLSSKLITDLLDPETLIADDELASVMLSDDEEDVVQALMMFDQSQRLLLANDAMEILKKLGKDQEEGYQKRMLLLAQSD